MGLLSSSALYTDARPILSAFTISVAPSLGLQFAHPSRLFRGGPAPVHTSGLSSRNALKLALATQIGFELGKHAKHIEKALAGGDARIDRLLCGLERCTARLNDPHHEHIALAEEVEHGAQFLPPRCGRAAAFDFRIAIESSLSASGTRDSAVSYSGAVHPSVVVC